MGYNQLILLSNSNVEEHKQPNQKTLWDLQLPPKVKIFLWRAVLNCLSTKENLVKKKVDMDSFCVVWGGANESTSHVFISYSLAKKCWSIFALPMVGGFIIDFKVLLFAILNNLRTIDREIFCISL